MQVLVENYIINFKISGQGLKPQSKAVVFLHGWGRTMSDFDVLAGRLAAAFPDMSSVQFDLPGFGGSAAKNDEGLSLENYVEVIKEFLDKLGVSKAVFLGHSFGGKIAIKFGAVYPERVEKLVLISAAGVPNKSFYLKFLAFGRGLFNVIFFPFRRSNFASRMKDFLNRCLASEDYNSASAGGRQTFKKVVREDLRPDAAKLKVPTLLIWGRYDNSTPLGDGEIYRNLIAGSHLEILACGHFPFLEKAEESSRAIISFLKDA